MAEILWGGGTRSHKNEQHLWTSGVWKPKDVGLAEVIDIWQTEYGSEPNILRYLTPCAYLPLILKNYTPTPTSSAAYEPPNNVNLQALALTREEN